MVRPVSPQPCATAHQPQLSTRGLRGERGLKGGRGGTAKHLMLRPAIRFPIHKFNNQGEGGRRDPLTQLAVPFLIIC